MYPIDIIIINIPSTFFPNDGYLSVPQIFNILARTSESRIKISHHLLTDKMIKLTLPSLNLDTDPYWAV
jgi:hypothetical protein